MTTEDVNQPNTSTTKLSSTATAPRTWDRDSKIKIRLYSKSSLPSETLNSSLISRKQGGFLNSWADPQLGPIGERAPVVRPVGCEKQLRDRQMGLRRSVVPKCKVDYRATLSLTIKLTQKKKKNTIEWLRGMYLII